MDFHQEIINFIKVWVQATASLSYTYYFSSRLPKGLVRLLSLLPVFYLLLIPPLSISSFLLSAITGFFLSWLTTFKVISFAFDQGPLYPHPQNLLHFISIACLPITIKQNPSPKLKSIANPTPISHLLKRVFMSFPFKVLCHWVITYLYQYKKYMHPNMILVIYCCHMYVMLDITLSLCATLAEFLCGFEVEPQFKEPYLATSLQDFWGRRWNLIVSSVLRSTVYTPTRHIASHLIGSRWAYFPAIIATFVVSGLMHDIVYYVYIMHVHPKWDMSMHFVLHGICEALELEMKCKRSRSDKWRPHPVVDRVMVMGFVMGTSVSILFAPLLRDNVDQIAAKEYSILFSFVREKIAMLGTRLMRGS
ncbi:1 2-diacyl-sn-glycerol:acetyl-CoA acetyltransferase [Tripterygium wilfordii]|uniref:1 2-diacyl-sn-glycerol:acetyl-CoA acetyltransferase n=2 Tax=Tripterygium wilfordii TaxID=458696 RepID=A0A7J7C8N2_TRIWF|nr:1 2-diacyl-sn-glycerol:acetyl-CoA acetyltransferase [Tripterygium wilfordii]